MGPSAENHPQPTRRLHKFIASKGRAAPPRPHSPRASCSGPAPRCRAGGAAPVPIATGRLVSRLVTAAPVPIATGRVVSRLDAAAPGHRSHSSPAVPLFPPGAMSRLGPQRDLEEAAALERRRRRELLRRGRIFNARLRTIGVRAGRKGGKAPCSPASPRSSEENGLTGR